MYHWEYYIAKRLHSSIEGSKHISRPAIRVAFSAICIGVVVMVVTLCVVVGFKDEIVNRVVGFSGHIRVVNFDNNDTYEMKPISFPDTLLQRLRAIQDVRSVDPFITKPCILKTNKEFVTTVSKGFSLHTPRWDYFSPYLTHGHLPQKTNEVLLSSSIAQRLQMDVDSTILCYFITEGHIQIRKVIISGIYHTGFAEYDDLFTLSSLEMLHTLNRWCADQVSGVEISLKRLSDLDHVGDEVFIEVGNQFDCDDNSYYMQSIKTLNDQIFAWLALLDMNVWVIIILMLSVVSFNIITALLILILNHRQFIGLLKALGATNGFLKRVLVIETTFLIGKGMLLGNVVALGLVFLQYFFHLIPLNASVYYIDYVPMAFPWLAIIVLNGIILLVCVLVLFLPAMVLSHISPTQVLRFK